MMEGDMEGSIYNNGAQKSLPLYLFLNDKWENCAVDDGGFL